MDAQAQLAALLELAGELGIAIRPAPAGMEWVDHPGGAMVRLKGSEVFFRNHDASAQDQIDALAAALATREELKDRYLPPELRELLERHGERA